MEFEGATYKSDPLSSTDSVAATLVSGLPGLGAEEKAAAAVKLDQLYQEVMARPKGESALEALEAVLGEALADQVVHLLPGHALAYFVTDQGGRPLTRAELALMPKEALKDALVRLFDPPAITYDFHASYRQLTSPIWRSLNRADKEQVLTTQIQQYFAEVYVKHLRSTDGDIKVQLAHLIPSLSDADLASLVQGLRRAIWTQRKGSTEVAFEASLQFLYFGRKGKGSDFDIRLQGKVWDVKATESELKRGNIENYFKEMDKKFDGTKYSGPAELFIDCVTHNAKFGDDYKFPISHPQAGNPNFDAIRSELDRIRSELYPSGGLKPFDVRIAWLDNLRKIQTVLFVFTSGGYVKA